LAQPFIDTSSDRGCALRASEAISDGGHDPRRFCGSAWPGDFSKHFGPSGEGQSYWSEACRALGCGTQNSADTASSMRSKVRRRLN